jgi:DMSO/TMAO reductase YedYZ molybdopterin-dependent catalytic subunit
MEKPLNREPEVRDLISSFITREGAYNRNHGPTLHLDVSSHKVIVDGAVNNPLEFSMEELKKLPQHSVTCALQCAGNRRHTMRTLLKDVVGQIHARYSQKPILYLHTVGWYRLGRWGSHELPVARSKGTGHSNEGWCND